MKRTLVLCGLLFLACPGVPVASAQQVRELELSEVSKLIVAGTNDLRQKQGQGKIEHNAQLADAVRYFAGFLSRGDQYGHTADGRRPEERAKQYGYDYCIVSENIAYIYRTTAFATSELAQEFLRGWERSPGHRKNMHDPDVTEIGVAVARNARSGYYYAVQMFGRPQSAMFAFEIENNTGAGIAYALGERSFSIPPGQIRTHRQCGSIALTLRWPNNQGAITVTPGHGDHFAIVKVGAGKYQLLKK